MYFTLLSFCFLGVGVLTVTIVSVNYSINNQLADCLVWKFIFFFVNNAIDFHRHAQIVQNKFIGFVYLLAKRTFIFLFIKKVNSFCSAESGTLNAGEV